MSKVTELRPCVDIPNSLRRLADDIESGEVEVEDLTIVGHNYLAHLGEAVDERAAEQAAFNLMVGQNLLACMANKYRIQEMVHDE